MTAPGQTRYKCGCVNATDARSGMLRSVSKCPAHRRQSRDPATLGEAYYAELGLVRDGLPVATAHVAELAEALGPFPAAPADGGALEVGCGASPYVGAIRAAGWLYAGIDVSPWAVDWVRARYGCDAAYQGTIEDIVADLDVGLILAAHVLEHLADMPGAVARLAGLLRPGGELWVVVPDDSDPVNPDHLFFPTMSSLQYCIEASGLVVKTMCMRKRIERENFIYARAEKPMP